MITTLDLYRSAQVLIHEHGEDAPIIAAQEADALLDKGNMDGRLLWIRIMEAAQALLSQNRPPEVTATPVSASTMMSVGAAMPAAWAAMRRSP